MLCWFSHLLLPAIILPDIKIHNFPAFQTTSSCEIWNLCSYFSFSIQVITLFQAIHFRPFFLSDLNIFHSHFQTNNALSLSPMLYPSGKHAGISHLDYLMRTFRLPQLVVPSFPWVCCHSERIGRRSAGWRSLPNSQNLRNFGMCWNKMRKNSCITFKTHRALRKCPWDIMLSDQIWNQIKQSSYALLWQISERDCCCHGMSQFRITSSK